MPPLLRNRGTRIAAPGADDVVFAHESLPAFKQRLETAAGVESVRFHA